MGRVKGVLFLINLIDKISFWSGRGVRYLFYPLIAVVFYAVATRYILHKPIIWGYETSLFIFGTIALLAGAYVLQQGGHVRVDIIYNRLSPRGKAIIDTITAMIFFYFIIGMLWQGGMSALRSIAMLEHTGSVWSPPMYPIKTVIPISAFLLLLQGLSKFMRDVYFAIRGRPLA